MTTPLPMRSVRDLRGAVLSFGRTPPSQQPAVVAHIRDEAARLHASELPWVANFLAVHPTPTS